MRSARSGSVLIVGAVVIAALSACTSGGSTSADAGPRPSVGQCHAYDAAGADKAVDTSPVISCAADHTAETFAVADALPAPDGKGAWTDEQILVAAKVPCGPAAHAAWLGVYPEEIWPMRVSQTFFTPSAEQAKAGARWIRCDAVLAAKSALSTTTGSQRAKADVAGVYARCAPSPVASQFDAEPCRAGSTDYAAVAAVSLGEPGSAYVGEAAATVLAKQRCASKVAAASTASKPDTVATAPTGVQWNQGQTYGLCWLRSDQWKVDPKAWPSETPGSSSVAV